MKMICLNGLARQLKRCLNFNATFCGFRISMLSLPRLNFFQLNLMYFSKPAGHGSASGGLMTVARML